MKNLKIHTKRANYLLSNSLNHCILIFFASLLFGISNVYGQTFNNIDQSSNGKIGSATLTPEWQNGNIGGQNSHFLETYSIPYRVRIENLAPNTQYTYIIGYDIREGGKMALDFLTYYQRLESHQQFGHAAEVIDPLLGISSTFLASVNPAGPNHFVIPVPTVNLTVNGSTQSSTYAGTQDRRMTIYGGVIDAIGYDSEGSLTDKTSESSVYVTFTTGAGSKVILAWGANIAGKSYWGANSTASDIKGSPYHMRHKGYKLGTWTPLSQGGYTSLGSTDRSLKTDAIFPTIGCSIEGNTPVCGSTTNTYTASAGTTGATYEWSITGNGKIIDGANLVTSKTIIAGSTAGSTSVDVVAEASGSFTLSVLIKKDGFLDQPCSKTVTINEVPARPVVTIQEATLCGTLLLPKLTVSCPVVGTYSLTQTGVSGTRTFVYNGSNGPVEFADLVIGAGFSITVTVNGCTSTATDCNNYTTNSCPTINGTSSLQSSSSSSLKGVRETKERDITAYPVPFRDKVKIEFKSERSGNYVINLYDIKGKLIKELKTGKGKAGQLQSIEVDGKNLPEGMYLIRVVDSAGSRTVKLLKKE